MLLGPTLGAALAQAQPGNHVPTPDDTQELRVIESTEQGEDPLGIDRTTGVELDEAAKHVVTRPAEPLPGPTAGAVLSALSQVSETSHRVFVKLEQGLAFVQIRMTLESRAKHASELAYRLALPEGAVIVGIAVCPPKGPCLPGAPSAAGGSPRQAEYDSWLTGHQPPPRTPGGQGMAIWAEPIRDAIGDALALRAAPLKPASKLEFEVRYVVKSPLRGGRVHLHLPARGVDPRIAATSLVRVEAPGFRPLEVADEFTWDATLPLDLTAEWPASARTKPVSVQARCGTGTCTRHYVASGAAEPRVRATWLLIDASPSMEGPARGRVDMVLGALLARLPAESPITAYAFAARAHLLGRFSADGASLPTLSEATMSDLDAASRPSSVLTGATAEISREKPRILILSDGLIDPQAEERQALAQARERGAEVWLLLLGDRKPEHLERFAHVLPLAEEADRALKAGDLAELSDALAVALSVEVAPGLRSGEERVRELVPNTPYPLTSSDHWLSFWARRAAQAPTWMAISEGPIDRPLIAALPYASRPTAAPAAHTAMPAESVLEMLRTQLVPKARACLRSDRRGRGDYAVALSFRAFFSRREVSEVSVDGKIPEHLRTCLTDLLPKLRVPAFSGGVRVRYPIHTDRESPPPVVEMTPEISESVQRVIAAPLARRGQFQGPPKAR